MTTTSRLLAGALVTLALLAGCGGKGKGDLRKRWMSKKWVPVQGTLRDVAFTAEIPEGLPANEEALGGKDWWIGTHVSVENLAKAAGPRMSVMNPSISEFADAEAFARSLEPDAARPDLIEVSKDKTADGRLRVVSTVKGGSHQDVSVWIPLAAGGGVKCTSHWWAGPDQGDHDVKPDTELLAWLGRFCDSIKLTP